MILAESSVASQVSIYLTKLEIWSKRLNHVIYVAALLYAFPFARVIQSQSRPNRCSIKYGSYFIFFGAPYAVGCAGKKKLIK